jgi:hypothetical protein
MRQKYKFKAFSKTESLEDIEAEIFDWMQSGWEVVSHSHSYTGMTVLFKKPFQLLTEEEKAS